MELKRTRSYAAVLFAALAALAFFGYEGVVIAYLVQVADWGALLNPFAFFGIIFVFVLLVANVLALALPVGSIWQARALRAVRANMDVAAPIATFQPDRELALRNGETLLLTRRARSTGLRGVVSGGITLAILALCGEAVIVPVLPTVRGYVMGLLPQIFFANPPTAQPSLLDWLAVAFPAALMLVCVPFLFFARASERLSRIVADDSGITSRRSRRRSRFIPWSDVQVFLRGDDSPLDIPAGGYSLWGREHFLHLTIHPRAGMSLVQAEPNRRNLRAPSEMYIFDGGFERYAADARRLLATIAVRANVPLRASASGTKAIKGLKRRLPSIALDAADALAAPEAGPPWQPPPSAVAAAPAKGSLDALLALRPRLEAGRMLVGTLLWSLPSALLLAAVIGWQLRLPPFSIGSNGQLWTLVGLGIFALLVPIGGYIFAFTQQRNRLPVILVDDLGITRKTANSATTRTLPWTEIRAWAVLPPRLGDRRGPTYFVFTDSTKLTWREPEDAALAGRGSAGDRRAAYRERAEQIHALIAARTGLPLRELGLGRPEPTVV